jgi:hypothetical protein
MLRKKRVKERKKERELSNENIKYQKISDKKNLKIRIKRH